jgi:predicted CxxxxCH...CXXCH cytochrome family protein
MAGAHATHMALKTTLSCDTCHAGSGSGTVLHYNNANARISAPQGPATVSIAPLFNAQSGGTAAFNPTALTCASTSCHGGQTTPNWQTGTIVSASQCSLCHAVNGGTAPAQFNDAVGRHAWGTHAAAAAADCTICHDMSAANTHSGAVNHFKYLDTPAVSGVATGSPADQMPSGTIHFKLNHPTYPITGNATYTISAATPEGDGGCALSCHNQNHDPSVNHWSAPKGSGVAHPVPFLSTDVSTAGNHHQTVTAAQFNGECLACHDDNNLSSTKTGPTCVVCHTLGSPLSSGKTAGTCLSCHVGTAFPTTGPTGSAWPNQMGAHGKHLALATFTRTSPGLPTSLSASAYPQCEACHVNAVPGDAANTHYSNASKRVPVPVTTPTVLIDPTFNAQSGAATTVPSTTAFTCSNVSCHGGQTTPGWQSGSLTVDTNNYCRSCHALNSTATQYNDGTGTHRKNSNHSNAACGVCHTMTNGTQGATNHWKYLDTQAVIASPDQLSSQTIQFDGVTATGGTYTPSSPIGNGNCTVLCHSGNQQHNNEKWTK